MTTPSRRLSSAPLSNAGPPRSVLQKLLEEINGESVPASVTQSPSQTPGGRSLTRTNSVWVGGGSAAEEAREKLRKADEARQRKQSSDVYGTPPDELQRQIRPHSGQSGLQHMPSGTSAWKPSVGTTVFKGVEFGGSSSNNGLSIPNPAVTLPERPDSTSSGKRDQGLLHSPDIVTKRRCLNGRPSPEVLHHRKSRSDIGPTFKSWELNSSLTRAVSRTPTFTERDPSRDIVDNASLGLALEPAVSSFRPNAVNAQGHPEPATPRRDSTKFSTPTSPLSAGAETPAWTKPFHLVDDGRSIFKNVHGEDWKKHPLCLDCYRLNGRFHRMLQDGCEFCGHEEVLKDHYWERLEDVY